MSKTGERYTSESALKRKGYAVLEHVRPSGEWGVSQSMMQRVAVAHGIEVFDARGRISAHRIGPDRWAVIDRKPKSGKTGPVVPMDEMHASYVLDRKPAKARAAKSSTPPPQSPTRAGKGGGGISKAATRHLDRLEALGYQPLRDAATKLGVDASGGNDAIRARMAAAADTKKLAALSRSAQGKASRAASADFKRFIDKAGITGDVAKTAHASAMAEYERSGKAAMQSYWEKTGSAKKAAKVAAKPAFPVPSPKPAKLPGYVTLGDGRKVTLGQYAEAWKTAARSHPDKLVRGNPAALDRTTLSPAGEARMRFVEGMQDRINRKDPAYGKGRKWDSRWQADARNLQDVMSRKSEVPAGQAHPVDLRSRVAHRLAEGTALSNPRGDRAPVRAARAATMPAALPSAATKIGGVTFSPMGMKVPRGGGKAALALAVIGAGATLATGLMAKMSPAEAAPARKGRTTYKTGLQHTQAEIAAYQRRSR